jgi:hypothetical protein
MTSNMLQSKDVLKTSRIKPNVYFLPRQKVYFCPSFIFIQQIKRKVEHKGEQTSFTHCKPSGIYLYSKYQSMGQKK